VQDTVVITLGQHFKMGVPPPGPIAITLAAASVFFSGWLLEKQGKHSEYDMLPQPQQPEALETELLGRRSVATGGTDFICALALSLILAVIFILCRCCWCCRKRSPPLMDKSEEQEAVTDTGITPPTPKNPDDMPSLASSRTLYHAAS